MPTAAETLLRKAYEAYCEGEVGVILERVAPDLEWTFLDPFSGDPQPQVCRGREELEVALRARAASGLRSELEEVAGRGERVLVVVRTPGLDARRARNAGDRNFMVFTVHEGRITAMRACRDREEALTLLTGP